MSRSHRLHALFAVALGLGLKRGELLGLRWVEVDQAAGQLRADASGERLVFGRPQ